MDRMCLSPITNCGQIVDKARGAALRSRLPGRSFLIGVGIAMAGGLLNPAYAEKCEKLQKELTDARNKRSEASRLEQSLAKQYKGLPDQTEILKKLNAAKEKVRKYDKRIKAISDKMPSCT